MKDLEPDIDQYLVECTRIEPMVIEEEYIRLPADLSYWNARYADTYRYWLEMKMQREQTFHRLMGSWRDQLRDASSTGKVTVSETESHVMQDPHYLEAKAAEIVAESEKVRLHGVMDALRTKRDMLISLGAHMRAEMERDPIIREQNRG